MGRFANWSASMKHPGYFKYDVFISHANEDKHAIAEPISVLLKEAGYKVWYSGSDLAVGDPLEDIIKKIIPTCRFAVVIISENFIKSIWGIRELQALLALEYTDRKIIFPVWHNITAAEIKSDFPELALRAGVYSKKGLSHVLVKLVEGIKKQEDVESVVQKDEGKTKGGITISGKNVVVNADNISGGNQYINKRKTGSRNGK